MDQTELTPAQRAKIADLRTLMPSGRVTLNGKVHPDGVAQLHCARAGRWWLVWIDPQGRLYPFETRPGAPCAGC